MYAVQELKKVLDLTYKNLNNGVYRCGFSGSREAYEKALDDVFSTLAELDERLDGRKYLVGDQLTEADVRCFPTLLRFDLAYYNFFNANRTTIRASFPHVHEYLVRLLEIPEFSDTVDMVAYPAMYGIICKWESRVAGNVLRILKVATHLMLGAARPDAPAWRRGLAGMLASPWTLLSALPGYSRVYRPSQAKK